MIVKCTHCGKEFDRKFRVIKFEKKRSGSRIYCSLKCQGAMRTKESLTWINCSWCGKAFQRAQHEVNRNKRNGEKPYCNGCKSHRGWRGGRKIHLRNCDLCGEEYMAFNNRVKYRMKQGQTNFYCSQACVGKAKTRAKENRNENASVHKD